MLTVRPAPTFNIKDLLFLTGDVEYADSPAYVNRALFASDGWTAQGVVRWQDVAVEVFTRPSLFYHFRTLYPVFLRGPNRAWHQPFYRSAGMATPDSSPEGTVWPISGLYTDAYCAKRGHARSDTEGYIGKHFCRPDTGQWVHHGKERARVWPLLLQVAALPQLQSPQPLLTADQ